MLVLFRYLVGKLYNALQSDPELMQASGLTEKEQQEAQANMELYQIMRKGIQAKKNLLEYGFEKRTLTPVQLKQAVQNVLICHSAMLGLNDGYIENQEAAYKSEEYEKLSKDILNPKFSKMTGRGRVQGEKVEATPYEITLNRLNLLTSIFPANKFTMQLLDKNWVKQYAQTIQEKANMSKIENMSREELRDLFSKKDAEIFVSLMPSSKLEAPKIKEPEIQVQKQTELNAPNV